MSVRMVSQSRSPGMQHSSEADLRAEVLGVGRDGDQGFGGGFEQQVIHDRFVLVGDVGDRARQGEDDMEIGHRQQLSSTDGEPLLGSGGSASGATPLRARHVKYSQFGARL